MPRQKLWPRDENPVSVGVSVSASPRERGSAPTSATATLIEAMLDGVWLVDPTTLKIIEANRAAARMMGASVGELIGCAVTQLASTPEDVCFWAAVCDGTEEAIESHSLLHCVDG